MDEDSKEIKGEDQYMEWTPRFKDDLMKEFVTSEEDMQRAMEYEILIDIRDVMVNLLQNSIALRNILSVTSQGGMTPEDGAKSGKPC